MGTRDGDRLSLPPPLLPFLPFFPNNQSLIPNLHLLLLRKKAIVIGILSTLLFMPIIYYYYLLLLCYFIIPNRLDLAIHMAPP